MTRGRHILTISGLGLCGMLALYRVMTRDKDSYQPIVQPQPQKSTFHAESIKTTTQSPTQTTQMTKPTISTDPFLKEVHLQSSLEDLYRDPSTLPNDLDPRVKVMRAQPSTPLRDKRCVPLPKSPRAGVTICIYATVQDRYVSGAIAAGRLWEENLVEEMANALKADPSLQMVDIGANIGQYTLFAAAMGHRVLAIEMLPSNVAMIQASLAASPPDMSSNVTVVINALSSNHTELTVNYMRSNVGGTHVSATRLNVHNHGRVVQSGVTVNAVCLDDLLPLLASRRLWMKMDIEGWEATALQCADKFFARADVLVVLMEWMDVHPDDMRTINSFMQARGYRPSAVADRLKEVNTVVKTVPGKNVFWIKS